MLTYKVWSTFLYEFSIFTGSYISMWSITSCLLLSILTIPIDIIISPIEILAAIIFGIVKLIKKIKE